MSPLKRTKLEHAIADIRPHVHAWMKLLSTHVAMLPPDQDPTPENPAGLSDRSYAMHELDAMGRDLQALLTAVDTVEKPPLLLLPLSATTSIETMADTLMVYFNGYNKGLMEQYAKARLLDEHISNGAYKLEPSGVYWLKPVSDTTVALVYQNADDPEGMFESVKTLLKAIEDRPSSDPARDP